MTDLYDKIVSRRNGLERVIAKIPGFRGYQEMTARREADRMMREHIVKLLREQMNNLINVEKLMMSGGSLTYVSKTRSAKTAFQTFIDKVNTAAPGYSGFFAAQKIGPAELERIYSFDAALIDYVDQFRVTIEALKDAVGKGEGIDEAIGHLESLAQEANATYAMRDNVLTEIY